MSPWKTNRRTLVADFAPFLQLESHDVTTPDGHRITAWPWLETPDYVNIFALTCDGLVVALEVEKYAVGGPSLALPGGFIEPGEEPKQAAQRELTEETGYVAASWEALGHYRVDANRGAGRAWFFLAREATLVGGQVADDIEAPQVRLLPAAEFETRILEGALKALPWTACAALALLKLRSSPQL